MNGDTPLRQFAMEQINQRLEALVRETARASRSHDEDAVHDLRVAIRRFTQGLILFAGLVPKSEAKKIRKQLKEMMQLSSEVRNRDIALEHIKDAKDSKDKTALERLQGERETLAGQFQAAAEKWRTGDLAREWRTALRLDAK